MSGNAFMTKDRSRIFNCCPDIKVLRVRVISRDEIKAGRVFVIKSGRIHKTSRARRLKSFRQLSYFKLSEVVRQSDKVMVLQELNHLCFATLISLKERSLIRWNVLAPLR